MEHDFLTFINVNRLLQSTDYTLLAVSGGIDSVVMANLFHQAGLAFGIAHMNFGLRGSESAEDVRFVENLARQFKVPFYTTQVDTNQIAQEKGVSIQMAARELRYTWFMELLTTHRYHAVATAHHQNDVLETLLLNLTRGTGLAGLHGISLQQDNLIRPLLFTNRAQIEQYAQQRGLTWRDDASNASDYYARNRIRHHVVPQLQTLNPNLTATMARTVERLRAAETLMRAELDRSWNEAVTAQAGGWIIDKAYLLTCSAPAFRLAEWLGPFGFSDDQAHQMTDALQREIGQEFLSATHRVLHERNGLFLTALHQTTSTSIVLTEWPATAVLLANDQQLLFQLLDKPDPFSPPAESTVAYIDADRLTFPLTIRPWQQGDRFRPLGLNGHKLVSNLLNDRKLSRTEREQALVLLSGENIAWVIGHRLAHPFRVIGETKRMVAISVC